MVTAVDGPLPALASDLVREMSALGSEEPAQETPSSIDTQQLQQQLQQQQHAQQDLMQTSPPAESARKRPFSSY